MILVVGSTGMVGGMIARLLLAQGQPLRILVRPGSNYEPLVALGAAPVFGDLKDAASLDAACADVDVLISTATSGSRGGSDTAESVDLLGNRHLIDAARRASVKQFIFTSTIAADESSPVPILRAKALTEDYLRASGVHYTILAADTLMDVMIPLVVGAPALAGRPVTLVGEGRRVHSFLAAQDMAAFAVAAVGHPAAIDRRLVIGGPAAISLCDAVATYERVLGRSIPVRRLGPNELLPNLPPVPGLAEVMTDMVAALDTFDSPINTTEIARRLGVELTPLEEIVRRDVSSARAGTAA